MAHSGSFSKAEEFVHRKLPANADLEQLKVLIDKEDWTEAEKQEAIECFRKLKLSRRMRSGTFIVMLGCFLCLTGFLITMYLMQQDADFHSVLYVTTGLGGLFILGGAALMMG